jgi:hypothetical protein
MAYLYFGIRNALIIDTMKKYNEILVLNINWNQGIIYKTILLGYHPTSWGKMKVE